MSKQKCYLCFDLGGTFIKFGIVNSDGQLLSHDKIATGKIISLEYIIEKFVEVYQQLSLDFVLHTVGVSSHGVINFEWGIVTCGSSYVEKIVGQPFAKYLSNALNLPIILENDVNAAALGELWRGGLKGCKHAMFLAFGTSVGGAITLGGRLYRGLNNAAGEAGYMLTHGQEGFAGFWEKSASATALMSYYHNAANNQTLGHEDLRRQIELQNP